MLITGDYTYHYRGGGVIDTGIGSIIKYQICQKNSYVREILMLWDYPGDIIQRMNEDKFCSLWTDINITPPEMFWPHRWRQ